MKRILRFLHEHGGDALIIILATAVVLTVEMVRRQAPEFGSALVSAKETVDVTAKVIGTLLLVAGAVAGYRKFLKGRIFAERLRLDLTSHPVRWMNSDADAADLAPVLLHSADLEVENVGATTIWEPEYSLQVRRVDSDEVVSVSLETEVIEGPTPATGLAGIEPAESVVFHSRFQVPEKIAVFRVTAELRTSGSVWHRALTLANTFEPEKEPVPSR